MNLRTDSADKMEFLEKSPADFVETLFETVISSVVREKNTPIDKILGLLNESNLVQTETDILNVRLVLEEAIINAIKHGNQEIPEKSVTIQLGLTKDGWAVQIEDEGDGFSPEDLPDPDDPASLFLEGGRGVFLIKTLMDRLVYYKGGSGVYIEKKSGGGLLTENPS